LSPVIRKTPKVKAGLLSQANIFTASGNDLKVIPKVTKVEHTKVQSAYSDMLTIVILLLRSTLAREWPENQLKWISWLDRQT
jgi:hypothetical protein